MPDARISRRVDELVGRGVPVGQAIAQAVQGQQVTTDHVSAIETTPGIYAITTTRW